MTSSEEMDFTREFPRQAAKEFVYSFMVNQFQTIFANFLRVFRTDEYIKK
jgi:hypothetical protein